MPNLVENLVDADHNYLGKLNGDIIIGIFQIADYIPVPEPVYNGVIKILDLSLKRLTNKSEPGWQEAKEAAHDPDSKKCYNNPFGKQLGDFVARSEVEFFKGLTENTYVGDYIDIPPDTDDIVEKMLAIPLCENGS
jgi:hypothetical protein